MNEDIGDGVNLWLTPKYLNIPRSLFFFWILVCVCAKHTGVTHLIRVCSVLFQASTDVAASPQFGLPLPPLPTTSAPSPLLDVRPASVWIGTQRAEETPLRPRCCKALTSDPGPPRRSEPRTRKGGAPSASHPGPPPVLSYQAEEGKEAFHFSLRLSLFFLSYSITFFSLENFYNPQPSIGGASFGRIP